MTTTYTPPSYITFTGIDRADLLPGMLALSARYPIEWGVLVDAAQEGLPLFPTADVRRVLQSAPLRLSAHICGAAARSIVDTGDALIDLTGFSRIQINHARAGSSENDILNSAIFGARHGVRAALQCQGDFPSDARVDWLYDVSFGTGVRPTTWPAAMAGLPFCGYSGGLGPDTVRGTLPKFDIADGASYWIDMESGVRTENRFDLAKCEAVCRIVFEELSRPQ
jgi:hypothetical protein